jgi:flagellar motor switch protein FliN/FliY
LLSGRRHFGTHLCTTLSTPPLRAAAARPDLAQSVLSDRHVPRGQPVNADNEPLLSPEENTALREAMRLDVRHEPTENPHEPTSSARSAPLTVHVGLGHRRIGVDDLLQLTVGSILELDVTAGTPLGIYVNQTLVAHGEVVVVGDHYSVRVVEIVTQHERVKPLGERR